MSDQIQEKLARVRMRGQRCLGIMLPECPDEALAKDFKGLIWLRVLTAGAECVRADASGVMVPWWERGDVVATTEIVDTFQCMGKTIAIFDASKAFLDLLPVQA